MSGADRGEVRQAAVLGHPIAHSLSPVLHRAAYEHLGLPWTYEAIDVDADGLPAFLDALDDSWVGLSLTMPLKEAVLPRLHTRTALVERAQAANTVVIEHGRLHGHNTDIPGMVAALAEAGIDAAHTATLLGTGATARSALLAVAELGVTSAAVVGRSTTDLARMTTLGALVGVDVVHVSWSDAGSAMSHDLVISTVPASVAAAVATNLPSDAGTLFDVLYEPWPTSLAEAWATRGPVIGGLDLLVHQARLQVELMTHRAAPLDAMRRAGAVALEERHSAG
jgi:shikimate dehydrogenase